MIQSVSFIGVNTISELLQLCN